MQPHLHKSTPGFSQLHYACGLTRSGSCKSGTDTASKVHALILVSKPVQGRGVLDFSRDDATERHRLEL